VPNDANSTSPHSGRGISTRDAPAEPRRRHL